MGLYDDWKRDSPAFVRVKAFHALADEFDRSGARTRAHVSGLVMIDIRGGRVGQLRASCEMDSDAIDRRQLPRLGTLTAEHSAGGDGGDGGHEHSHVDNSAEYRDDEAPPGRSAERPGTWRP